MIAEIIAVGTELLLGNIVNSNAQYLSEQFANLGVTVYYHSVVGDNKERLINTFSLSLQRADVVILTGGLGPTQDDITKEVISDYMNRQLIIHESTKQKLERFFKIRQRKMTKNNLKQALIPEGSIVLENNNGTAPGLIIKDNTGNKTVILLPGPPNEMKPLFDIYVKDYIRNISNETIYSKVLKVVDIGESDLEERLIDLIQKQTNPTIAPYAKEREVHLRITAKASNNEEAEKLIEPIEINIKNRLGNAIYTDNVDKTLEDVVIELLKQHNFTISVAESCTGGLLSATLINCSGASSVYKEGVISYSNEVKNKRLDVSEEILSTHGDVSSQTAEAMALGIANRAKTDISLSITGIAGPTGGSDEKPVGLVYIGCYVKGKCTVEKYIFNGNRQKIRKYSVISALNMLRKQLINN